MSGHDGIGGEAMRALSDGVDSLCLVKECRDLEEAYGTTYCDGILSGEDVVLRDVREDVRAADRISA